MKSFEARRWIASNWTKSIKLCLRSAPLASAIFNFVTMPDHTHSKLSPSGKLDRVLDVVETAKSVFRGKLQSVANAGGLTREQYIRYLSFQYHLTKGVQRHFLKVAAHPRLAHKNLLREFLFRFGLEEEPHYKVAEVDLERMGEKPLPCPLDVSMWWAYFDQIVEHRPFVRLGATCVLENLGSGAGALGHHLLESAPFLNKSNTRFLTIHFHELLPHGDQVIGALERAPLDPLDIEELVEGTNVGSIIYMRMALWATQQDELTCVHFNPSSTIERHEDGRYLDLETLVTPES